MPKKLKKSIENNSSEHAHYEPLSPQQQEQVIQKKKSFTPLFILIILLIIVDGIALFVYIQPDFTFFNSTNTNTSNVCVDQTPFDQCSKNQPKYCYNGELVDKAFTCGCPQVYTIEFQSCKKL